MNRNTIALLGLAFLLWGCGPQDYDECMLEKMKGQDASMRSTVDRVCEKRFPYEKQLYFYKDEIEIAWYAVVGSLRLKIEENRGDYRITKYTASFSERPCDQVTSHEDYVVQRTFTFAKGETEAVVHEAGLGANYKCMRTDEIFGIRK